jgi:hypothetical protein
MAKTKYHTADSNIKNGVTYNQLSGREDPVFVTQPSTQPHIQNYKGFTLTRSPEGHALWSCTRDGEVVKGLAGMFTGLVTLKENIDIWLFKESQSTLTPAEEAYSRMLLEDN